jgi:hypothetical protein
MTFAEACARPGFRLVHYSLQGNRAHPVVEARDRDALGRGMKSIAARLARAVNRIAGRAHSAERTCRMRAGMRPGRERPSRGQWTSIRPRRPVGSKVGRTRYRVHVMQRPLAPNGPLWRLARTWLLAVGWRPHGLLDPADIPG